jgi:transcriptional regulator with XRE-family HTH domain
MKRSRRETHDRIARKSARLLKEKREELQLTRPELAERCGLTIARLARLERGRDSPYFNELPSLARGLGMSLELLSKELLGAPEAAKREDTP